MVGANIKKLRMQHGMTQKNLADKLFVSAQAVSRWENEEVEPSIGTLMELSKIFGVTADELLGIESKAEQRPEEEQETCPPPEEPIKKERIEPARTYMIACEQCRKPIFNQDEAVRKNGRTLCRACGDPAEQTRREVADKARRKRTKSFIFGTLAAVVMLIITFSLWSSCLLTVPARVLGVVISLMMFTFVSCCILNNNFVGGLFLRITMLSIRWPGLIFTFDFDGIMWLIGMKILFAVLGFLFGVAMFVLALAVGCLFSVFVYPYAIVTNARHPEREAL